jgi:hypothetical protein
VSLSEKPGKTHSITETCFSSPFYALNSVFNPRTFYVEGSRIFDATNVTTAISFVPASYLDFTNGVMLEL